MKKVFRKMLHFVRNIILLLFILSLFSVILYKYVPVYYTTYMLSKNVGQLTSGEKIHLAHHWKPLKEISPDLWQAVIASEDYMFLIHNGFDTDNSNMQLNRGARILYQEHTTISQQTARNVFLFPGESYFNEMLETYYTILIEFVWGKERILEVYLNSVEMGNAIYGAESMARKSFALPARDLDVPQAALIAACLVNPIELNPTEPTTYLLRRQAKIMGIMNDMMEIQWEK